ncbi:MAG: transposase [Rhizobium sp.]|nr:transposase [Flaviaesturariibacter sp.]MDB5557008.1 transposase [Rhizobium sp.]
MWYYQGRKDDTEVIAKLSALAEKLPTRGFDKYYGIIRNEGLRWGRSRVLRVYRELKLTRRRRHKRRLPARIKEPLEKQLEVNYSYSMDFMSDALVGGRKLRVLKVVDDCTRESLAVWCDFSIPGEKVVAVLEQIIRERGKPQQIRVDNGPEFRGKVLSSWCQAEGITIKYIQPGRPMQNAYIERLNRTFREDVLDAYLFDSLEEVRILSDEWQDSYNNLPHDSLKGRTPLMQKEYVARQLQLRPMIEVEQKNIDQQMNIQSQVLTE